jgi:DegV family protein with EDD domain
MRKRKIVADSSADITSLEKVPFGLAPLKIIAGENEFVDDETLDVAGMVSWFDTYSGRSQTSCPNPGDWLEAFGDAQEVFCVAITSGLSGSYNAACAAKELYEAEHPDRQVVVIDSLSAGPELRLLVEKLQEFILADLPFEEICQKMKAYQETTGLVFMLESLKNFAANGRISPAIAKIAGVLGIRVVGKASNHGTLEPTNKCRGQQKALEAMVENMVASGLQKGKVRLAHCKNEAAALTLKTRLEARCPQINVEVHTLRGLCSYYAEKGGLLIGFEKC